MQMKETPRQFAESMARKMKGIIERGEDAMPLAIAHATQGPDMILGFEFSDEHSKNQSALAMQMMAKLPDVEYVVFLSDTWMAILDKDTNADLSQGVRNYPQRKEAIVATIFGRNLPTEIGYWLYERIEGKVVFTEKIDWQAPQQCEGRFVPPAPSQKKTNVIQ